MYAMALSVLLAQPVAELPEPPGGYLLPPGTIIASTSAQPKTFQPRDDYADAYHRAGEKKKLLRIFVGVPVVPDDAFVCVSVKSWSSSVREYPTGSVITLQPGRERAEVVHVMLPGEVRRSDPFSELYRLVRPTADGRAPAPVGEKYERARYTQSIAVTGIGGRDYDRRTPVDRLSLERKWHQSGGMEGVTGYRSDVYRFVPKEPKTFVGDIGVLNSFGSIQQNRGWKREYADGTLFEDVLTNTVTGKVFEHRIAFKQDGKWLRRSVFRDDKEYPPGYFGLQMSCASCHDEAGTGNYGVGLVPGGDTILSDPFPELETGRESLTPTGLTGGAFNAVDFDVSFRGGGSVFRGRRR